jgi:uncharacterized protein (TIGR02271 family)
VVGVFDSYSQAEQAVSDLTRTGIARDRIEITANESALATASSGTRTSSQAEGEGFAERIGNFFRSLFGNDDDDDARHYSEAVRRGGAVVTVTAADADEADRVADVMDRLGAVDVDARAKEWTQSGWAGSPQRAGSVTGSDVRQGREAVIPVVQEELQVGKRRRERGGVRIYTHMEEDEARENITLREEHAIVERRSADRPATEADFAAFKEGTIEVRETVEEPVVGKTARVVEEVVVGKEVSERTETVSDSVRHGEVDVERLGASPAEKGVASRSRTDALRDYDSDYQTHWRKNYADAGGTYEEYEPAYRYGASLAQDERYRGRQWNDIERDARLDWETRNRGSTWERFKAAVRHGWENVTGRR